MGKYDLMANYIENTPKQMKEILSKNFVITKDLKKAFLEESYDKVVVVACGSSFNAANCAKYAMERYLGTNVLIVTPYSFVNYYHLCQNDFVFVVSQSGCSTNAIEALDYLGSKGYKKIGVTANIESDFKDYTDLLVDYNNGIETVGYVTKGVTDLVLFLILFSLDVYRDKNDISKELKDLEDTTVLHTKVLKKTKTFIASNYKAFTGMDKIYFLGAGHTMGVAYEAALKVGETFKIPSFAYEFEEYIHGPNLQLTPNYTVVLIDDGTNARAVDIYKATKVVTDNVFIITPKKIADSHVLTVETSENVYFTALYYLPFVQYLAYRISEDLQTWEGHPLMKEFSKIAVSKTKNYHTIEDE